jgi:exodeoxyribonuclease VII small subunit
MPSEKPLSFEDRLARLEQVVKDLEGEDLPLESALQRYREGVDHLRACRALLDDAEKRLVELVAQEGPDGSLQAGERPLKVTDRGLEPDDDSA